MTDADLTGDAAWSALLPAGTVSTSRTAPWALRSRPGSGVRAYIGVPRRRPLIVASWDRAVLQYLADSVLSVPPGGGRIRSMALTAGLRMLRYRGSWLLAVALRAGGVVLVGRPE
ncbi:MAG TPA: hypothetical protein VJ305_08980 [Streptosporangiaceae bacterium]|jgi:hypothetical protein|nr:hypothetical protein [Streptosporangiaceae bacterium]